ncbi:hypothetical protein Asi03nite_03540 [Actinoplanes siamensis]|uniref:Uncharacterized protein n=1 Tax=Actinoplanes siamensis TaxID=1223317 RepID=A0A919N204_9ACTN|nr:hypothetical protein Asi03nite_03540 [Actinoplanes siamensis]
MSRTTASTETAAAPAAMAPMTRYARARVSFMPPLMPIDRARRTSDLAGCDGRPGDLDLSVTPPGEDGDRRAELRAGVRGQVGSFAVRRLEVGGRNAQAGDLGRTGKPASVKATRKPHFRTQPGRLMPPAADLTPRPVRPAGRPG